MKFSRVFGSLVFLGVAAAFNIATPAPQDRIQARTPFVVEIDQPDSQGSFQPVSVVIGLQLCGTAFCSVADNDQVFGQILFAGDYTPARHETFKPPYQNFTFTIDNVSTQETAVLHVAQLALNGAGPSPILTSKNVTVLIRGFPTSSASAKFRV